MTFKYIIWKIFIENLAYIRLFPILAFIKTAYDQMWPFLFLGPGNPDDIKICCGKKGGKR